MRRTLSLTEHPRRLAVVAAVGGALLSLALVGGAIAASRSHGGRSSSAVMTSGTAVTVNRGASNASAGSPNTGPSNTAATQVVRAAALAITAHDVTGTADRAGAIARAAGGRVDSDVRSNADATLTLRIPNAALDSALTQLAALGSETSRNLSASDVSAQQSDLTARISAQRTSVARLQSLLAQSGSLSDLLAVETQLTQRQADLESLEGQQRGLADQVALSTLTLAITATAPPSAPPTGFAHALAAGWHGLLTTGRWALVLLGYALPTLLVVSVVALAVIGVRRTCRHARVSLPFPDA